MRHIREFLILRMRQMRPDRHARQLRLFEAPREKGSGEWRMFNAVTGDIVHAHHARMPQKAVVVAEKNHVLRITYPPVRMLRRV